MKQGRSIKNRSDKVPAFNSAGFDLAGLLAALALILPSYGYMIWDMSAQQARSEVETEYAARDYADSIARRVRESCDGAVALTQLECVQDIISEARVSERNERDLQAQETMARWTIVMGGVASLGMLISIIGVGLVYITFRETRRAASAGIHANEIARESSERQLRAYVGVVDFGIRDISPGKHPFFSVKYENAGQTPAGELICRSRLEYTSQDPTKVRFKAAPPGRTSKFNLAPGGHGWSQIRTSAPLSQSDYDKLKSGQTTYVFAGYIIYRDAFGIRRFTLFRTHLLADTIEENGFAKVANDIKGNLVS